MTLDHPIQGWLAVDDVVVGFHRDAGQGDLVVVVQYRQVLVLALLTIAHLLDTVVGIGELLAGAVDL
ncbi:hypothetical protein D3C79_935410 [compost metagenome]